ncbi:BaiN/RdsA family NAD(P)/FAD-dependent oxidoreductase [Gehongia tenuis]|uniref:NAD(P)/FAD-dependent oxidoreductase n=1 Tax=Gehongia tenuis TaxID=2763655 RepID=A0A926HP16_9FIRM|nr:NAD(P)/FAD-dependent oxidoreductase [Gehongia tenuis]MBC8531199.1 NAD(P)/FAD-dependent oxidoreductase [Gehongia tenuis]
MNRSIAVIGGGAAGMLAAYAAAQSGAEVTLFEANEKLGKKLYITGKGRCNVTSAVPPEDFLKEIPHHGKFLYSAFAAFNNEDLMTLLEKTGVPLKVERGMRVFPQSDKSSDIIRALERLLGKSGVKVRLRTPVKAIWMEEGGLRGIELAGKRLAFDRVIVATGGVSYPATGSTGEGHRMLARCGQKITELYPSLVPIETAESWPRRLQGLALKNVRLHVREGKKNLYNELGELLFTHFGISGPLVLTASSHTAGRALGGIQMEIDMKPALSAEQLDRRLVRDFESQARRQFQNALDGLMPKSMVPVLVELSGISGSKPVHQISKGERESLVALLKGLRLTPKAFRPFTEAIITRGGVDVREIRPATMESKTIPGLYVCGELLDVDGYTGGFNLQIAFTTGYAAGTHAAKGEEK